MQIKVEQLNEETFGDFGVILGESKMTKPNIQDDLADVWLGLSDLMDIGSVPGKQVTFLKVHSKPATNDKIERHVTSAEAFIPLVGKSIIMLVPEADTNSEGKPEMSKCRAFLLDGSAGILLKPGTWHAVPWPLSDVATFLVLVDDAIIEKNDLNVNAIEEVEFDVSGVDVS